MALSRIEGRDELYVGGIWALRRSDSLTERRITHVLSLVPFSMDNLKNFKDEPWTTYGRDLEHLVIDIDDVDDTDLLIELPRAVKFIDEGLRSGRERFKDKGQEEKKEKEKEEGEEASREPGGQDGIPDIVGGVNDLSLQLAQEKGQRSGKEGAVFVHCAAGKSRSVAVIVAYLLWKYPNRFDPNTSSGSQDANGATAAVAAVTAALAAPPGDRPRKDTAAEAVAAALEFVRRSRPMAEPNDGFTRQLELFWEMGCPADDMEAQPAYQRWAYKREVEEHVAIGQAPSRLRFEDEEAGGRAADGSTPGLSLRCKKCRRTLVTAPFIQDHKAVTITSTGEASSDGPGGPAPAPAPPPAPCPHFFIEPLGWMRGELEKGELNGRLLCPNARCGAGVGRYDWKGFKCSCGGWVTPAFSLQRGRVDDVVVRSAAAAAAGGGGAGGIRLPPGHSGRL
ncbi:hypothetical protein N3K66_007553 [Trichothecium roseum]|uniref:Uncharacterized protein n=1 Tax=Trichothecium roseum TaxID=47278 RepID=A0ACC0UUT9_9HYPO|nr:hypothetical protein N3K66_007553 [Trichothecium roseum]